MSIKRLFGFASNLVGSGQKSLPESARCRFTNNRGIRCEHRLVDASSGLCSIHLRHQTEEQQSSAGDKYSTLFESIQDFETRDQVRIFLACLMRMVVLGEIQSGQAAFLCYSASLILQALPHRPRPALPDSEEDEEDDPAAIAAEEAARKQEKIAAIKHQLENMKHGRHPLDPPLPDPNLR
jgi:hypothetical protein